MLGANALQFKIHSRQIQDEFKTNSRCIAWHPLYAFTALEVLARHCISCIALLCFVLDALRQMHCRALNTVLSALLKGEAALSLSNLNSIKNFINMLIKPLAHSPTQLIRLFADICTFCALNVIHIPQIAVQNRRRTSTAKDSSIKLKQTHHFHNSNTTTMVLHWWIMTMEAPQQ